MYLSKGDYVLGRLWDFVSTVISSLTGTGGYNKKSTVALVRTQVAKLSPMDL